MGKLSAYIREGAQKRPQAFGDYIQKVPVNGNDWQCESRTCAIGAAYEAITGKLPEPDWLQDGKVNRTIYRNTGIKNIRIPYPQSFLPNRSALVVDVVSSLNDAHWSREQIADYLEPLGY